MYESAKKNGVIDVAVLLLVVLFRKLSFYLPESEHVLLCGQIQTLYQTAQTTHPTPFNSSYFSSIDMTGFSSISLLGNVSLLSHLFPGIPFLVSVEPLLLERNSNPTKLLIRKTEAPKSIFIYSPFQIKSDSKSTAVPVWVQGENVFFLFLILELFLFLFWTSNPKIYFFLSNIFLN